MILDTITPVILTLNEDVNIGRSLNNLKWAKRIVVVDSFSIDQTEEICARYQNVQFFKRKFDSHSNQWNYAIKETGITSEWILALDADFLVTEPFKQELSICNIDKSVNACYTLFDFAIHGKILPSSIYPPVAVLFRREKAHYIQDGHTQRLSFEGSSVTLKRRLILDDRKSIFNWVLSQNRYAKLEAEKILTTENLTFPDKLRKMIFLAPFVVMLYCLFIKRTILCGWEGVYYTLQRTIFESLLSLYLVEKLIVKKVKEST